jgi:uncharacterized repeat protein (TIGR04138 family)
VTPEIAVFWDAIKPLAGRYPPAAFSFVLEGLRHTVRAVREADGHGNVEPAEGESRHISGQELCLGLRDFAIEQYGLLARAVLGSYGIARTDDFGRIVFILVEAGLMRKTEDDRLSDFEHVFDFEESFASPMTAV